MPNENIKKQNIEKVLETAGACFLENGIDFVTMETISRKSGVSRASVGRYFTNKPDCVMQTAKWLSLKIQEELKNRGLFSETDKKNGLGELKRFMEISRDLFMKDRRIYVLRAEFKAYLFRVEQYEETDYEKFTEELGFRSMIRSILKRGTEDGSIRPEIDMLKESIFLCEFFLGFMTDISMNKDQDQSLAYDKINYQIDKVIEMYRK